MRELSGICNMGQGKYKPQCGKMTYNTEQGAWEHVVHFRRQGYAWLSPYKCHCGKYHLTRKWFTGKVPVWVKEQAGQQSKKQKHRDEKKNVKTLPLEVQKEIYKQLNNKPASLWLRIKSWL